MPSYEIDLGIERNREIFLTAILPAFQSTIVRSTNPVAIILGGQPGSGKSNLVRGALERLKSSAVIIDGDYLRAFHPRYRELFQQYEDIAADLTQKDTNRWVEQLRDYAVKRGANIIIEGTMRDRTVPATSAALFRGAGYQVEAHVLAVPSAISLVSIFERYELNLMLNHLGRRTSVQNHDRSIKGLPASVALLEEEKMVDTIFLYQRRLSGVEVIYENHLKNGTWCNPPNAQFQLVREQSRMLTPDDKVALLQAWINISSCALSRSASKQYIAEIDAFRSQSVKEVKSDAIALQRYLELYGSLIL